jgi:outer membrane immunogenic protein
MRKLVLGGAAVAAVSRLSANVQGARHSAVIVPPPVLSWTGLYFGAEGGGGWGHENFTDNSKVGIPPGMAISHRPDGGIFGDVLGYRYQAGQLVFGVEGTGAWADLKDSVSPVPL